jgi:mannose-6-phosphate isomerase-like protein (cupin superfamily)
MKAGADAVDHSRTFHPLRIRAYDGLECVWGLLTGVQRWRVLECDVLNKPDIQSRQLIWPKNSPESQVTITHVTMEPGSVSERHAHACSEQVWVVERGEGILLLGDEQTEVLRAGDIVRTPAKEIHGVVNSRKEPLVYLSVTTPPQNFSSAYNRQHRSMADSGPLEAIAIR